MILRTVPAAVERRLRRDPDVPALFYYALFGLTDHRKFALAVEQALPPEGEAPR